MDNTLCKLLVRATRDGYTIYFEPGFTQDCTRVVVEKKGLRVTWDNTKYMYGNEAFVMCKIKELMRDLDEVIAKERF